MKILTRRRAGVQKANPTQSAVYVSAPLTTISVAYTQSADAFIADRVFPRVPVAVQGGKYFRFNKADFLRDEARVRADATESAGGGFNIDTADYLADVYAFHKDVGAQTRANYASVLQGDKAALEYVMQKLLIRRERAWFARYFTTGVWGTDVTGVSGTPGAGEFKQWDAASGSDPAADIDAQKAALIASGAPEPNTLVLGYQVFSRLRTHAAIKDQFKYTGNKSIDREMMAQYFGVERILVSKAVYAANLEGTAAAGVTLIGGKSALLVYAAPNPSIMTPSGGYTFTWDGYLGAGQNGIVVSKFWMDPIKADRIEAEMAYDMKVVASDVGVFFATVIA